jgi:hypothetical protein
MTLNNRLESARDASLQALFLLDAASGLAQWALRSAWSDPTVGKMRRAALPQQRANGRRRHAETGAKRGRQMAVACETQIKSQVRNVRGFGERIQDRRVLKSQCVLMQRQSFCSREQTGEVGGRNAGRLRDLGQGRAGSAPSAANGVDR